MGHPKDVRAASGLSIARVDARPWQSAYRTLKERWPDATLHGTATHVPQARGRDLGADIRSQVAELQIIDVETLPPTLDDAFVWFIVSRRARRACTDRCVTFTTETQRRHLERHTQKGMLTS